MKKIFSLACLMLTLLLAGNAHAQLSINAAYIHQSHTFYYQKDAADGLFDNVDYLNGGMIGVSLNAPLLGRVGLAPGAYLSFASAKQTLSDTIDFSTSNINLKVPFYLNFKIPLSHSTNVLVFGGPVFNVGLSSLANYKNVADQVDVHFDMGGTIGAGIQFYRFRIFAGYNIALIDREDFSLANKESVKKAWEGSTLFAGVGISLGRAE